MRSVVVGVGKYLSVCALHKISKRVDEPHSVPSLIITRCRLYKLKCVPYIITHSPHPLRADYPLKLHGIPP